MRILIQRVKESNVSVKGNVIGKINEGLMLLVSFTNNDNEEVIHKMAKKCVELRIFQDENDKMNLSLLDLNKEILSISQFTLYSNCKKGRRPSFEESLKYDEAKKLYEYFNKYLKETYNIKVEQGEFGADMQVSLINDGPLTIMLDSEKI